MSASSNQRRRPNGGSKSIARRKMEEGVALRPQADEIIAGWWRYLPLVAVAFGLGGLLAFALLLPDLDGLVFGYVVMYIAGFVMLAILTYKQTRRLTAHMSREESIRQGMLEGIRARIEAGEGAKADQELTAMELVQKEASQQERLPNQAYAAMSVLPLVGLVVGYYYLYHLNRVTFPHDARWLRYLQEYFSAGSKVGVIAPSVPSPTVAKRSFALYALISLAFFPFLAYWYHVMIGEVNRHFQGQWKAEDELLSSAD